MGASAELIASCRTKLADVLASRVMALKAIDASWATTMVLQDTKALRQALELARTYGVAHPTYVRRAEGDQPGEAGSAYVARAQAHLDAVETAREAVRVLFTTAEETPDKIDTSKLTKGLEDAKACGGFEPMTLERVRNVLEDTLSKRDAAAAAVCDAWRELSASVGEATVDVSAEGDECAPPPGVTTTLTQLITNLSGAQSVGVAMMGALKEPLSFDLSFVQHAVPGGTILEEGANVANTGAQLLLLVSNAISSVTHSRQAHFEKLQAKLERSRTLLMKAEQYAADGTLQGGAADYTIASKANALRISLEADLELAATSKREVCTCATHFRGWARVSVSHAPCSPCRPPTAILHSH